MHLRKRTPGFSLVELLVAVTVLALLGAVVVQMMGTTSRTVRLSNQIVDTASQARLVFDCLGTDLSALIKRPDVPFEALNATSGTTNLLRFVSNVPSASSSLTSTTNRSTSLVTYQVAPHTDNAARPCLVRAGKAIAWSNTGYFGLDPSTGLPLAFSSASFPATLLPQTADFHILAPGVIRVIVGFQLYPDNQSVTLQNGTQIANARGQVFYSPPVRSAVSYGGGATALQIDLSRISALVVGLVVIDLDSLRLLNADQVNALAAAFPVPTQNPQPLPVAAWGSTATQPSSLPSSVPLAARQSVRVFQRFYPIHPFASRQ
jgi:prepilin-type N-terminal cleavage/methylation domain-containing protein